MHIHFNWIYSLAPHQTNLELGLSKINYTGSPAISFSESPSAPSVYSPSGEKFQLTTVTPHSVEETIGPDTDPIPVFSKLGTSTDVRASQHFNVSNPTTSQKKSFLLGFFGDVIAVARSSWLNVLLVFVPASVRL